MIVDSWRWWRTDDLGNPEAKADGGHDGGDNGEPRYLIEIGDLRQENLHDAEHDHVSVAAHLAGAVFSILVEAVGPLYRPVLTRQKRSEYFSFKKEEEEERGRSIKNKFIVTHTILIEAAIVYPIATPTMLRYWR